MGRPKASNFLARRRRCAGLTLVELLVALVIVSLLLVMLFPARSGRGMNVRRKKAKVEISQIEMAMKAYESTYHRWPVRTNVEQSGMSDFTFGTFGTKAKTTVTNGGQIEANNSELISIVMDAVAFGDGRPTPNAGHALNAQRNAWLNAKTVSDTDSPGVGLDGVYRDPWGNSYIITIDLNRDGHCRDAIYKDSLIGSNQVFIWSFGPDCLADPNKKPDEGVNKDNVVSWR